jgi:hypothetical protein
VEATTDRGQSRFHMEPVAAVALGVSLVFSAVFIARSAFTVRGKTYFSLFDDAMISMRYARNLAEGHGLVWNAHQAAVEGYSNLLWTLWFAVLHVMRIPEPMISLAVMLTGALLLAANVLVVGAVARILSDRWIVRALAMILTATYYPLVFWTLRGMEVGELTLIVSTATLLALRLERGRSDRALALLVPVLALGVMTRTDAVVPMAVVALYVVATSPGRRVRRGAILGASIVIPLAAQTLFRELYYHALLPNTYYLKVSGVDLVTRLRRGLEALAGVQLAELWLPTLAATLAVVTRRSQGVALIAGLVLSATAYSVYVGGDAWEEFLFANRYLTPVIPLLFVLAALGLDALLEHGRSTRSIVMTAIFVVLVLGAALHPPFPREPIRSESGLISPRFEFLPVVAAAAWIALGRATRSVPREGLVRRVAVPLTASVLLGLAADGRPVANWIRNNGESMRDDATATRYGVALRASTSRSASIALDAAGAVAYFSHRPAIDLLGKSDAVIAHSQSHPPFWPGHSRWNYAYSIGRLQPDVVNGLFFRTDAEREDVYALLDRSGYVPVASALWVRRKDPDVDVASLRRLLAA